MTRRWFLGPALLLAACATQNKPAAPAPDPLDNPAPHLKNDEIHADLIQQMLDKGQYYAALAHIEDQKRSGDTDQLRLLEAEARRHLGQHDQAETLYRSLLNSPYAASAYHGLGMLYVDRDLDGAIHNLRQAVERAPTNVDFRNDLGYAVMTAGQYTEAYTQLSTAAELAPQQTRSQKNLIILWLVVGGKGNEAQAQKLAQGLRVTPEEMQQLRESALNIRSKQNPKAAKPAG